MLSVLERYFRYLWLNNDKDQTQVYMIFNIRNVFAVFVCFVMALCVEFDKLLQKRPFCLSIVFLHRHLV